MTIPSLKHLHIKADHIVYEVFEDEVLAINLDIGTYYSLPGPSSRLWLLIAAGVAVPDLATRIAALYDGDAAAIAAAVDGFVARLMAEHLVEPGEAMMDTGAAPVPKTGIKPVFTAFEMNVFTDMQDLLLLDPIHDVEDSGWPLAKPHAHV